MNADRASLQSSQQMSGKENGFVNCDNSSYEYSSSPQYKKKKSPLRLGKKIYEFYNAPITKFWFYTVGFCVIFVIMKLKTSIYHHVTTKPSFDIHLVLSCWLLVGCFEYLRCFSDISAISRFWSRRQLISEIVAARPRTTCSVSQELKNTTPPLLQFHCVITKVINPYSGIIM